MRSEPVTTCPLLARTSAMPLMPAPPMPIMWILILSSLSAARNSLVAISSAAPGVARPRIRPASNSCRSSSSSNASTRPRSVAAVTSEFISSSAAPFRVKKRALWSWWSPVACGKGTRIAALPTAATSNSEPAPARLTTTPQPPDNARCRRRTQVLCGYGCWWRGEGSRGGLRSGPRCRGSSL